MLLTDKVVMRITSRNRPYYKKLGYDVNKEYIEVKVDDLPKGSHYEVDVKCDYCEDVTKKEYRHYISQRSVVEKDACRKCTYSKESDLWGDNYVRKKRSHNKGKLIYSYEFVKNCVESEGFTLLTTKEEYVDFETKIKYLCGNPNHKPVEVRARMFVTKNHRCQSCYLESLRGENSPRWKGGNRETILYFRGALYEWERDSLKQYDSKCPITGISECLEIHHIRAYSDIITEAFKTLCVEVKPRICDYTQEELNKLALLVQEIHRRHLGVPLFRPLHKLLHTLYGTTPSESQYYDFLERCKHGDLKEDVDCFISYFKSGLNNDKSCRKVVCLETGDIYDSIAQASRETNITTTAISRSIITGEARNGTHWIKLSEFNKKMNITLE